MKRGIISIMFAMFILCLWCVPVKATLITIEIEGVVDSVRDTGNQLGGKIKTGDTITGTYTYNLLTPDSEPSAWVGVYEHHNPPAGISVNVGDFTFLTNPDNVDFIVEILNDYPPSLKDQFWMRSYNNISLPSGISVGIAWWFDYLTDTFSTDALPATAPVLENLEWNIFRIGEMRIFGISGHITSATLIPEPTTFFFVGFGALILRRKTLTKK